MFFPLLFPALVTILFLNISCKFSQLAIVLDKKFLIWGWGSVHILSPALILEMQKYLKSIRKLIAVVEDHAVHALLYKLI
jgi:hypothetical protein